MHRNLVQLSGDACREGYIGERGFESGSYQLNALPYADFFGYFLVQRQESNAPQGPERFGSERVISMFIYR